jgi:tetratricopeptide (TPR) repeat protein
MIAKNPDTVRDIDTDLMNVFMRQVDKTQVQRNENRIIALAHLGYCSNSECGDGYAADAIKILVRRGDFASATDLLPTLKDSDALQQMLVLRRFAPLWSAIEARAGSHFNKIKQANLAAAEKTYRASPNDYKQLQRYVDALAQAGRLKEATALKSRLPSSKEGFASADESLSWAVNSIAYALDEAGRMDEADHLFEQLNDGASPDADWLVNTKINRLEVLLSDGRYDKVLPLLDSTAKVSGSPFAYQLIRQIRYCTVSNLSGSKVAAKYLPDLLTHAPDSFDATVDALVCAGDLEEAEKVALDGLAQTDSGERAYFEAHFVRDLQVRSWDGYGVNAWHGRWQNFRKRPAIAAAFARLGRDLPEEFAAELTN